MIGFNDEGLRDVAQLVEYTSGGREVARSSRVIPTNWKRKLPFFLEVLSFSIR